jgi:hypothetical protein
MKRKSHIFANMQHCWQHYITHPRCQPAFPIAATLLKYKKYWWYLEILEFHLVVRQRKNLRTLDLKHFNLKRTCN